MPDYYNEDNSIKTENATVNGIRKSFADDVGLDVASLKIIELSKKIRELNAALVSERNRCNNLCQVVRKLESESVSLSNKVVVCSLCRQNKITAHEKNDNTSDRTEQEKKLKKTECAVLELRQKVQILNHDLQLAKKVVEAETGEIIPNINTWLTNLKSRTEGTDGAWRGRQQQIIALKNKIARLQSQLAMKAYPHKEDFLSKDSIGNETFSGATLFGVNYFQDDSNNGELKSPKIYDISPKLNHTIEENETRTSVMIQLQDEKKRLEEDIDSTRKNLQKTKLRVHNLLQEQKELKQQIMFIIQKGKHDDELVESLVRRTDDLQNELNRITQSNIEKDNEIERINHELANLEQRKDTEIKRLEEIIDEKNQFIDNMNERLAASNQIQLHEQEHEGITGTNDGGIQSNLPDSSHYDDLSDTYHIKNLTIERDGLIKLIENMECRIEELIHEKMRLEMQNTELTKKTVVKPCSKKTFSSLNDKTIKSDHDKEQILQYLTHENYLKDLISQCSLSAHSMKIITKCIQQFQTVLIQCQNEITSLKDNLKLTIDYRRDDLKLVMQTIEELKQQNLSENK
ncbi:unnamed protein product [Schistosoma turkestanicum]|nr:unnamed protein product [Schistosoma turkestanicum]